MTTESPRVTTTIRSKGVAWNPKTQKVVEDRRLVAPRAWSARYGLGHTNGQRYNLTPQEKMHRTLSRAGCGGGHLRDCRTGGCPHTPQGAGFNPSVRRCRDR